MPYYEVQHTFTLSSEQRENLAAAITNLHTLTFNTPSLFVNIKFTFIVASNANCDFFIGGQARPNHNIVVAHVRSDDPSTAAFQALSKKIEELWDGTVGLGSRGGDANGWGVQAKRLNAVFVVPGLVAREAGLAIPEAGGEEEWLRGSMRIFEQRAKNGDEDVKALIEEVGRRGLISQT